MLLETGVLPLTDTQAARLAHNAENWILDTNGVLYRSIFIMHADDVVIVNSVKLVIQQLG